MRIILNPQKIFKVLSSNSFLLIYIAACFIVSIPLITSCWTILYQNGFPSGGDPAVHTSFVLRILSTGNLLVPYSQFPELVDEPAGGFYPTLFHILIAGLVSLTMSKGAVSTVSIIQSTVFIIYMVGIVGYALTFRFILLKYLSIVGTQFSAAQKHYKILLITLLVLGFSIFIYSSVPVIKTLRDGGYSELLAMWGLFPFYLFFLMHRRWYFSAVLLAIIASSHNLSFIMSLSATIAFVAWSFLFGCLNKKDFNKLLRATFLCVLLILPAIVYFYLPVLRATVSNVAGSASGFSKSDVELALTTNLFYAGIVSSVGLLWLNYRYFGWIPIWSFLYFLTFSSPFFAERFARELSIPFGITVGLFSILILFRATRWIYAKKRQITLSTIVIIAVSACIMVLTYNYFNERLILFSDPRTLNYNSETFAEAGRALHSVQSKDESIGHHKPTIISFGINKWLKSFLYDKYLVLDVVPPEEEQHLSAQDRSINHELRQVLSESNQAVLKKYDIQYVIINSILNERWYPSSYFLEQKRLETTPIPFNLRSNGTLVGTEGEYVKIYKVE